MAKWTNSEGSSDFPSELGALVRRRENGIAEVSFLDGSTASVPADGVVTNENGYVQVLSKEQDAEPKQERLEGVEPTLSMARQGMVTSARGTAATGGVGGIGGTGPGGFGIPESEASGAPEGARSSQPEANEPTKDSKAQPAGAAGVDEDGVYRGRVKEGGGTPSPSNTDSGKTTASREEAKTTGAKGAEGTDEASSLEADDTRDNVQKAQDRGAPKAAKKG
jgi:hypothetical protein